MSHAPNPSPAQIRAQSDLISTIAHNRHIPEVAQVAQLLQATYRAVAKFSAVHTGGIWIWCNGRPLLSRPSKFKSIECNQGVIYLKGNLHWASGGTHQYPSVGHKGAECILEFTSYGLPVCGSDWTMHILELERLADDV